MRESQKQKYITVSSEKLIKKLKSSRKGLSQKEAKKRLRKEVQWQAPHILDTVSVK